MREKIAHACVICCKYKVKPAQQISALSPVQCIEEEPPFEITGVDFAGPLCCKSQDKVYIALFTCAVTRAIHSELVTVIWLKEQLLASTVHVSGNLS